MKIAIIGGKFQGCEAAYLARKAGWETVLIERPRMFTLLAITTPFFAWISAIKNALNSYKRCPTDHALHGKPSGAGAIA